MPADIFGRVCTVLQIALGIWLSLVFVRVLLTLDRTKVNRYTYSPVPRTMSCLWSDEGVQLHAVLFLHTYGVVSWIREKDNFRVMSCSESLIPE
jgi:hypothetical protein